MPNNYYSDGVDPYVALEMQQRPRTLGGMVIGAIGRGINSWAQPERNTGFDPNAPVAGENMPYKKAGFWQSLAGNRANSYNQIAQQHELDMQRGDIIGKKNMNADMAIDTHHSNNELTRQTILQRMLHGFDKENMGTKFGYDLGLQNNSYQNQSELSKQGYNQSLGLQNNGMLNDVTEAQIRLPISMQLIQAQKSLTPEQRAHLNAETASIQDETDRRQRLPTIQNGMLVTPEGQVIDYGSPQARQWGSLAPQYATKPQVIYPLPKGKVNKISPFELQNMGK